MVMIAPLHIRALLDDVRTKIANESQCRSWEELHVSFRTNDELAYDISQHHGLSDTAAHLITDFNQLREEGNIAPHVIAERDVRSAVLQQLLNLGERRTLEEVFEFLYGIDT